MLLHCVCAYIIPQSTPPQANHTHISHLCKHYNSGSRNYDVSSARVWRRQPHATFASGLLKSWQVEPFPLYLRQWGRRGKQWIGEEKLSGLDYIVCERKGGSGESGRQPDLANDGQFNTRLRSEDKGAKRVAEGAETTSGSTTPQTPSTKKQSAESNGNGSEREGMEKSNDDTEKVSFCFFLLSISCLNV